mmetsp:Transcript_110047/g.206321  ORF Transcript_110047/g.206321 Transcript_110047/m.206321 type:complete len:253 (-) Transcript_110047:79-837(-)
MFSKSREGPLLAGDGYYDLYHSELDPKDFSEESVRNGFIRKVYGILSVQLVITAGIVYGMLYEVEKDPSILYRYGSAPLYACLAALVLVLSVRCCCVSVARTFPSNYLFLLAVTLLESFIVGFISSFYTGKSVMIAAVLTAGIFGGLTMFAMTTETDFTGFGPYLLVSILGLIFTGMFSVFLFPEMEMAYKLYSGVGAVLMSFYIVFDTQMIVGGKHEHKHDVDDYVFAALNLYLDIITLFMKLLSLGGERR